MRVMKDTVADLLDVNSEFVSADFIKNHMDELGKVVEGDTAAIDTLKSALADDLILNIMVENGIDESTQAQILSDVDYLQSMMPDLEIGATIDDGEFLTKANDLIAACGMTVDQANAMFDALGFEATFDTKTQVIDQKVPRTITETRQIG